MRTDDPISRRIVRAFIDFLGSGLGLGLVLIVRDDVIRDCTRLIARVSVGLEGIVDTRPDVDVEALEVAKDCLREVFRLDQCIGDDLPEPNLLVNAVTSQQVKQTGDVKGHREEANAASAQNFKDVDTSKKSNFQDNVRTREDFDPGVSKDEIFSRFIAALEKIPVPRTVQVGYDDHALLDRAIHLFEDAEREIESSGCKTFDYNGLAEALKKLGNKAMQSELYVDAIERYTCAITLRENNAVFYCNRAAAYTHLQKYKDAISDCLKAIEIDPNYSKAYSRLGHAYFAEGNYSDAINKGFVKGPSLHNVVLSSAALQLDPTNDTVKENLKIAVQKLKELFERHQNGRPGPSSGFNQGSRNHATGGSQAAPSPSPSFTFNVNSFPTNVGNMFTNMFPNPHQGQDAHSREAANNHEDRTPPTYTSAPFDAGSIPANLASMFANFPGRASQGHNYHDQPQAGSDSTGYNDPGINLGGNINVNIAEQMPEEVMGTLRSVLGMFQGVQEREPQGNQHRRSHSS
ncbi:Small glutamine-rich tetratricopeptide repeat-containing protein [Drosera capensis]